VRCQQNRFKMAQIMVSWSRQTPRRARSGLWPWNQCKKSASAGEWEYIGSHPKGKMEIPAQMQSTQTIEL